LKLNPISPPGRATRKVRGFGVEIRQLRAQGYSFQAIQTALAEAGLQVSKSTVQREAKRPSPCEPGVAAAFARVIGTNTTSTRTPAQVQPITQAKVHQPPGALALQTLIDHRSGKDIAKEFMQGRITNPLIRASIKT
jgi:hypothetical protein